MMRKVRPATSSRYVSDVMLMLVVFVKNPNNFKMALLGQKKS